MLAASLVLVTAPVKADVLVNTFGPNDAYTHNDQRVQVWPTRSYAARLTPAGNFTLNSVEVPLRCTPPVVQPVPATFSVVNDAGGVPGSTVLWTSTQTVSVSGIYTFVTPAVTLIGGETYWLVASCTSNSYTWYAPPTSTAVTMADSTGTTWTTQVRGQLAYRVSSVPIACCNPSTGHCALSEPASCVAMQLRDLGTTTCAPDACGVCRADFDQNGATNVDDLFLFLNEWFVGCP